MQLPSCIISGRCLRQASALSGLCECLRHPAAAIVARRDADKRAVESLLATGVAPRAHAYADGGMHSSFRMLLERNGAKRLAKTTSRTAVPISRPEAALADPHSSSD